MSQRRVAKIAVLTDCSVLRAGFETIVKGPDFSLVGFASKADDMVAIIDSRHPDALIVPTGDGALEACASISKRYPALPVLILSTALDDGSVRDAIEAGANGFLFKDVEPAEFQSAIKRLVAGESVLDTRVAGRVIAWATDRSAESDDYELSARELEALRHVARGEPNKRIARHMGIKENTVKTYLRRAYRKLGCHTRSAAAAILARRGQL